jgi:hypothetical protein
MDNVVGDLPVDWSLLVGHAGAEGAMAAIVQTRERSHPL